jgi:sugar O-acyltransferase (sialic acid O-acetyltransferase NeuD family)
MDEIILVGAGGHARSCMDVIEHTELYKIVGLVEKHRTSADENLGYPIIGTDDDLKHLRRDYEFALVTVGQIKSAETRVRLFNLLKDLKFKLPVIISPRSHVSRHCKVGDGTIIMHDAIVNANSEIGRNSIINNKVLIEHDVIVGNHCHIATGAILNGEVTVGNKSFIGSGAVTKQSISIGSRCVIGAGSLIKSDVESNQVIRN